MRRSARSPQRINLSTDRGEVRTLVQLKMHAELGLRQPFEINFQLRARERQTYRANREIGCPSVRKACVASNSLRELTDNVRPIHLFHFRPYGLSTNDFTARIAVIVLSAPWAIAYRSIASPTPDAWSIRRPITLIASHYTSHTLVDGRPRTFPGPHA